MDRDRVMVAWNKVTGAVKKGMGRATGNSKPAVEGHVDKSKGDVQNTVGGVKDSLRSKP